MALPLWSRGRQRAWFSPRSVLPQRRRAEKYEGSIFILGKAINSLFEGRKPKN